MCADIKWVQDSSHPKHPLKQIFKNTKFRCNLCKVNGDGLRLRCDRCKFNLHEGCSSLPPALRDTFAHSHRLLRLKASKGCCLLRSPRCRLCHKTIRGAYYKCAKCFCGVSFHPLCSRLQESVVGNPLHPTHPLILIKMKKAKRCDVCKKKCRRWRYHCRACKVHIHIKCLEVGIDGVKAKQQSETGGGFINLISNLISCFASFNTN